jgi:hypothetical protein
MTIRILALLVLVGSTMMFAQAQAPQPQTTAAPSATGAQLPRGPALVGSVSDIMSKFIYPVGDEVFYIRRSVPQSEQEWIAYEARMLMLAESGNLLMMPGRARDQDRWMRDARLLVDAGTAAYKAAQVRDVAAIEQLNDQMYNACVVCHQDYRPNYRTRVPDPEGLAPLVPPGPPQR